MRLINKVIDSIINFLAGIAAVLIGALLVSISYATFSRFLFSDPKARIIELSAYSLIYITFLAAPWLLRMRGHINVDLILINLKGKVKTGLYLVNDTVGFIITSVLFYFSYDITMSNYTDNIKIMDSVGTPQFLLLIAIPIGSLFLAIQFLRFIKEDFVLLTQKKEGEQ